MKRLISLIALLVVAAMVATGCAGSGTAGEKVLTIGICEPMTGGMASSGQYSVEGATLAVDEINAAGGVTVGGETYKLQLSVQDNEGKTDVTINAYNKLIGEDKVIAIIGTNTSGTSMAAGPVATKAKVPAISPIATNPDVTTVGGDYVFRVCMTDDYQGVMVARAVWELLGCKRGCVLFNNSDDFSVGIKDLFVEQFESFGGEVHTVAYAGADVKDFRAQLTEINEFGGEFLFVPAQPNEIPLIIQQVREIGIDAKIVGDSSWEVDTIPEIAGADVVEGCYFLSMFAADSDEPAVQEYSRKYQDAYDHLANSISVLNYDAVYLIKKALEDCGTVTDSEALRNAIANVNVDLVVGKGFTFSEERNPAAPTGYIMQYQNGLPVFVASFQ